MSQVFRSIAVKSIDTFHWYQPFSNATRERMDAFNALSQDEKKRLFEAEFTNTNSLSHEGFDNVSWTRRKVK